MKTPTDAAVFREGFYFTYPHANGFRPGGRDIVLGRLNGLSASLWKTSLDTREDIPICEFDVTHEAEKLLWFDVAEKADRLATVAGNGLWIYDLKSEGGHCIYRAESSAQVASLCSISADGRHVVVGLKYPDRWAALWVDVDSGKSRILFEKTWFINHFHFSPHDENWIGFCHEGLCDTVSDRVWGWHAELAPEGRVLFEQHWDDPTRQLYAGHERWCYHATAVLVVAYGASPGEPRGIYEVVPDKKSRLIVQGDRHLHVNVSRSGRFIVIDTSGPYDLAGRGWEDAQKISDILLLDTKSGEQRWLARSRIESHPSHPHPVFSPDDKLIFFNEAVLPHGGNRIRMVENILL